MGNSGIESKTYYLDGVFPYSDYLLLKAAFNALYPLEEPVGLCITPIKAMPTATTFYSTGIKVMLVRFVPGTAVDEINFLDVDNATTMGQLTAKNKTASNAENLAYVTSLQAAAKKSVSNLAPIDWWNDTLYYHKTNEFEYCFIDRDTFVYLASDMNFYKKDVQSNGATLYRDKVGNLVDPLVRGLHFSRAFITMEDRNRIYDDYRSLKFRPFPEPALVEYDSRPSTAYYLGPVCPPRWYDEGSATAAASAVPPQAPRSLQLPPKEDCTCNAVNMVELHKALKKAGEIGEDMGPAYRVNLTPIVVATALSFLFILLAQVIKTTYKGVEGLGLIVPNVFNVLAYLGIAFIGYVLVQLYRRIA